MIKQLLAAGSSVLDALRAELQQRQDKQRAADAEIVQAAKDGDRARILAAIADSLIEREAAKTAETQIGEAEAEAARLERERMAAELAELERELAWQSRKGAYAPRFSNLSDLQKRLDDEIAEIARIHVEDGAKSARAAELASKLGVVTSVRPLPLPVVRALCLEHLSVQAGVTPVDTSWLSVILDRQQRSHTTIAAFQLGVNEHVSTEQRAEFLLADGDDHRAEKIRQEVFAQGREAAAKHDAEQRAEQAARKAARKAEMERLGRDAHERLVRDHNQFS